MLEEVPLSVCRKGGDAAEDSAGYQTGAAGVGRRRRFGPATTLLRVIEADPEQLYAVTRCQFFSKEHMRHPSIESCVSF
jgi:hypothetical protein